MQLFLTISCVFMATCALALIVMLRFPQSDLQAKRLQEVVARPHAKEAGDAAKRRLQQAGAKFAHKIRMRLGMRESQQLKDRLLSAGLRGRYTGDVYFGARCLMPLCGAFAGSFIPSNTIFWLFTLALAGYMAPDVWLTAKTRKRKERIRRSLPDAIDLLVICVDAGLGLDQALMRVGEELAISHPDINQEFVQVNLEQRAGRPRLEAWQSLSDRTRIEEFAAFVGMLTQTDRFGTPILRALSRFAEELRMKRRQRAEEAAAKTKIKIIFPLVICIFPCIFIVLLAPAIIGITNGMRAMGR